MNKSLSKKWKYTKLVENDLDENQDNHTYSLLLDNLKDEKIKENKEEDNLLINFNDVDTSSIKWKNDDLFNCNQSSFELKQRSLEKASFKNNKSKYDNFIIYQIQKDDTLQKIALKCYCSINDLKRLNNLVSDQDFYALRYLKIPMFKYGILSEVLVHQINQNNDIKSVSSPFISPSSSSLPLPHCSSTSSSSSPNTIIINVGLKKTFQYDHDNQDLKIFLSNLDKDLEKIRKAIDNYKTISTETLKPSFQIQQSVKKNAHYCDGADCGFHWLNIFIIALIIFVLLPVIYAFVISNHESN